MAKKIIGGINSALFLLDINSRLNINIVFDSLYFGHEILTINSFYITLQNCIPLTLLPSGSSGGDQIIIPHTLGTTIKIAPLTPDLAGKPTCISIKKVPAA